MKKLISIIALCLITSLSFGQKKAINFVKNEIKNDKPNISEARSMIKGATNDPETKDLAETWFLAGQIENKQFDMERTKELIGQKPDEKVMYGALGEILPFFQKADELDQLPDKKGKVKPKYRKDMKPIMIANRLYYINGGAYYFEQKEYQKAYDFFRTYLDMPDLKMFDDDKEKDKTFPRDSMYTQIKYYAAIAASQMKDSEKAIKAYEDLKNDNYRENEIYQFLAYEYEQVKDTVNLMKVLKEGVQKFPEESYYLLSLINLYIYTNQNDEAIEYLNEAIERKPNDAQLYDVLGRIYENKKEMGKALEYFQKALNINPDYVEAMGNTGRIYFNDAVEAQAAANEITDNVKYKEAKDKSKELFKKALPYFEKAHEMKPEDRDYMIALRGIYYNLNMEPEYEAIEKKLTGE